MILVLPILLMMFLVAVGLFILWLGAIVIYIGSFLRDWRRVRWYFGCLVVALPLFGLKFLNGIKDGLGLAMLVIGIAIAILGVRLGKSRDTDAAKMRGSQ